MAQSNMHGISQATNCHGCDIGLKLLELCHTPAGQDCTRQQAKARILSTP